MTDRIDSMGDFYGEESGPAGEMIHALERWDYDNYRSLEERDPVLYKHLRDLVGFDIDIQLGQGDVKLGLEHRQITLTWSGSRQDLVELVLEGATLIRPA